VVTSYLYFVQDIIVLYPLLACVVVVASMNTRNDWTVFTAVTIDLAWPEIWGISTFRLQLQVGDVNIETHNLQRFLILTHTSLTRHDA
jgi:hypothetical protein